MANELSQAEKDENIEQFLELADFIPDKNTAKHYLEAFNYDVSGALEAYFAAMEDGQDDHIDPTDSIDDEEDSLGQPRPIPTSGSQGPSATSTSASRSNRPTTGVRTLNDLSSTRKDDQGADDDSDNDYFTGGEKSGLAVHGGHGGNHHDRIQGLLDKARRDVQRPGGDDPVQNQPSHFAGRGVTLGGDDAPSEVIEGPPRPPEPRPRVRRTLHLWRDGFSVDDGPLFRYDDPQNQQTLDMIHRGRAPIHLLNVEHGQEVDLELDVQKEQPYVAPKPKYKPFAGKGQRLGSPTPGASSSATSVAIPTPAQASATTASDASQFTVDESQPIVRMQIRLADGTRLQSRFNGSHTIGDVYNFVDSSSSGSTRPYTLMTTFPNKDFEDRSAKLEDLAEFKRGGMMVQKWT